MEDDTVKRDVIPKGEEKRPQFLSYPKDRNSVGDGALCSERFYRIY